MAISRLSYMERRLVRLALPVDLLNEIDAVVAREASGYGHLGAFVEEAVRERLFEISIPAHEPTVRRAKASIPKAVTSRAEPADLAKWVALNIPPPTNPAEAAEARERDVRAELEQDLVKDPLLRPRSLEDTKLVPHSELRTATIARGIVTERDANDPPIDDRPPFGLHNRDYPSLWALRWLTRWTADAPIPLQDFLREVTHAAWWFAGGLERLPDPVGMKLTTMFPTGKANPGSSSQTFHAAAVGRLSRRQKDGVVATGPLPLWNACRIWIEGGETLIAPTREGYELLEGLGSVSLQLPHAPGNAERFIDHLRRHGPADHRGFTAILEILAERPGRGQPKSLLQKRFPEARLSDSVAEVNAQGYISRAREWGLAAPRLVNGRYVLTDAGQRVMSGL